MIKSELANQLVKNMLDISEKDIALSTNLLLGYMSETLANNGRIEIRGFGSFSLHYRPPRNAHNPKTGEKVITGKKFCPHFKPGKDLKEKINSSREKFPIEKYEDVGEQN